MHFGYVQETHIVSLHLKDVYNIVQVET